MSVILVVSVSIRVLATIWSLAVMLRLRDRRILFLTAMLMLMAIRQILTLAAGFSSGTAVSFDFAARPDEIPGLMVTLMAFLVVLNLEGLVKRAPSNAGKQLPQGVPILSALGIGLAAILGIVTVSLSAYVSSQNAIRQIVADDNLALAQTICSLTFGADHDGRIRERQQALDRIRDTWSQTSLPYSGSHLSIVGPTGTIDLHTGHAGWQGEHVGDLPVSPQSDETLLELLQNRGSFSGRNVTAQGVPQLVGYHYEPVIDSLVIVHTPLQTVDSGFRNAVVPWVIGIALIGGLLMPLSLGLLFHSSRQAHNEAVTNLTALQESEEKFRVLTERNPAIVLITRDNQIVYGNAMLSTTTGYASSELIGLQIDKILHPAYRHLLADLHPSQSTKDSTLHQEEMVIITNRGEYRWLDMSAQAIDFEGHPSVLVTCRDLTQRKQAEEQLRQKESQLAHVSRVSAMGEMVAGIAHEINQPLAAIANFALASKNALEKANCQLEQPVLNWLERINNQALACGEIIQRLRNFVTKDDGIRQLTDLKQVIRDSLALVHNEIRHSSISIETDLPDTETSVYCNSIELQQVIVNLLRNACDALQDEASPRITIRVKPLAESMRLTIEDNGPGIPQEQQRKMFDAFFTTKAHGMGMGLAISKSLIEAHGGNLRFDDGAKSGATFHVDLPSKQRDANEP